METSEFTKLYQKLNPEQKRAVDAIEGPVMVVAGPGTGKTQILTLRIANILLKTDTAPENILALTFTESGVSSMRKRLADIIGAPAYRVLISTFHGFSNDIIQNNPEEFPHIIGSRSITEVEQITLIEEILEKEKLTLLKPAGDPLYFVRGILGGINELKREGVSLDEFDALLKKSEKAFKQAPDLYHEKGAHKGKMKGEYKDREKQIAKNKELAVVYDAYEKLLRLSKLYDYNDMIVLTLRALRSNEDLLLRLQENSQYILVDEHQDTNNAQNKILLLLSSHFAPRPNLFVVGDEKQSIFRFQGASLENFLYFKHLYPEAELITLKENYRSTQSILDSAGSLIPGEFALRANSKHALKPIELYALKKPAYEHYFVARSIQKLVEDGVDPHEIAVLYRDNKDALEVAGSLKKSGILFQVESDQNVFNESSIRKLLIIARAVQNYGDDRALSEYFHLDFFNIEPLDVFKILRSASQKIKYSLFDIMSDEKLLKDIELSSTEALKESFEKLSHLVKRNTNQNLEGFFEEALRLSGLLAQILQSPRAEEELDTIDSFMTEVRAFIRSKPDARLFDFFSYLKTLETHKILIKKKKGGGRPGYVRLMTAHRSKGLEFEYVFIIHAHDGKWGNKHRVELLKLLPEVYSLFEKKTESEQDGNDDERRLMYVALTRAKKHVTVSYSRESEEGKEGLLSQFISEIDSKLISVMNAELFEKEFEEKRGEFYKYVEVRKGEPFKDKGFVREHFTVQGLSVSALNNYLSCPWKYFYRNLIRLPEPIEPHLMYGTAVHEALNQLFRKLRIEEGFTKKDFVTHFIQKLSTEPFQKDDLKRYKERGEEVLSAWYDEYSSRWITNTLTEFAIRHVPLTPDIILTGKLDKLELLSEREVNVVDYKTGKPKTRNQILGKTKDADGSISRQLVFYKILLDKFKDGEYEMVSGEIDFIEPTESGKYVKEKFTVTKDDTDDLIETIERVGNEILTLSFWDKHCDDKDCEYCRLREMIGK